MSAREAIRGWRPSAQARRPRRFERSPSSREGLPASVREEHERRILAEQERVAAELVKLGLASGRMSRAAVGKAPQPTLWDWVEASVGAGVEGSAGGKESNHAGAADNIQRRAG